MHRNHANLNLIQRLLGRVLQVRKSQSTDFKESWRSQVDDQHRLALLSLLWDEKGFNGLITAVCSLVLVRVSFTALEFLATEGKKEEEEKRMQPAAVALFALGHYCCNSADACIFLIESFVLKLFSTPPRCLFLWCCCCVN